MLTASLSFDELHHLEILAFWLRLFEGRVVLVENIVEETCVLRGLSFSGPRIDSFLHFKFNY